MSVNPLSEALPLHQAGTIRALAVTGAKRSQFMPNVPTAKESGYDVVVESWLGVFLPPKTPADVVRALSTAMKQASRIRDDEGQPRQVRQRRRRSRRRSNSSRRSRTISIAGARW